MSKTDTIGVFIHIYYTDLIDEIRDILLQFKEPVSIYISTDSTNKELDIRSALSAFEHSLSIKVFENIGRDIAPFIVGFHDEILRHDICLRLHTKKSTHAPQRWGEDWRRHLFTELCGSSERIAAVIEKFRTTPNLGYCVASHWPHIAHWIHVGENARGMNKLLSYIGIEVDKSTPIEFPSGAMFWFRSAALKPMLDVGLQWADFRSSKGEDRDSTIAHAIERSFFYFSAHAGYSWTVLPLTTSIDIDSDSAITLLRESGLFDNSFYLMQNPDVAAAGDPPLEHYFFHGFREGRDPSGNFETRFYERISDCKALSINPLLHYLLRGRQLGLPTFSAVLRPERTYDDYSLVFDTFKRLADATNDLP